MELLELLESFAENRAVSGDLRFPLGVRRLVFGTSVRAVSSIVEKMCDYWTRVHWTQIETVACGALTTRCSAPKCLSLACVLLAIFVHHSAMAQQPTSDGRRLVDRTVFSAPSINIVGPAGKIVVLNIGYFDDQKLDRIVTTRVVLQRGRGRFNLEADHSGYWIKGNQVTNSPIGYRIVETETPSATTTERRDSQTPISEGARREVGGATTETLELRSPGSFEILLGQVPQHADFAAPDLALTSSDRELLAAFRQAIRNGSSQDLVADLEAANIDVPCVDAFLAAIQDRHGQLRSRQQVTEQLTGWSAWPANLGARGLHGSVQFERGRVFFTLFHADGKLVDLAAPSEPLPDDWFYRPATNEPYIKQAQGLIESIFAGNLSRARQLFSPRYQEQMTVESLASLSDQVRSELGTKPNDFELKWVRIVDELSEKNEIVLRFCLAMNLKANAVDFGDTQSRDTQSRDTQTREVQRGLAFVDFVFPASPSSVGRGHLVHVNVRETWASQHPSRAQQVMAALKVLATQPQQKAAPSIEVDDLQAARSGGDRSGNAKISVESETENKQTPSTVFLNLLPESAVPWFDQQAFARLQQKVAFHLDPSAFQVDWDLWSAISQNGNSIVSGPVIQAEAEITAECYFTDGKLLGVSLFGPDFSVSTLDCVSNVKPLTEVSEAFWRQLMNQQSDTAYLQLAEPVKASLSTQQLAEIAESLRANLSADLRSVHVERVRWVHRVERPEPMMLAVYCLLELEDESQRGTVLEYRPMTASNSQQKSVATPNPGAPDDSTAPANSNNDTAPNDSHVNDSDPSDSALKDSMSADSMSADSDHSRKPWEITRFDTDFDASYPLQSSYWGEFNSAFQSGKPQRVLPIMSTATREVVDQSVLSAFLRQFKVITRDMAPATSAAEMRVFEVGQPRVRMKSMWIPKISTETATPDAVPGNTNPIHVTAEFTDQGLATFHFESPLLSRFVQHWRSDGSIEAQAERFLQNWLAGDLPTTAQQLVPALRTQETYQRLKRLRSNLAIQHGDFQSAELLEQSTMSDENRLEFLYRLRLSQRDTKARLQFELNAINAKIALIQIPE